jgi:hypothetical protein
MKTGMVPNPCRNGAISRVLILSEQDGQALCLDPAPFDRKPELLRAYNPGYVFALKFWRWISALVVVAGIAGSFLWHWWVFIPGLLLSTFIHQMNSKSAGQFAAEAFRQHESAAREFQTFGALFMVPGARVLGRRG